ncbi:TPA: hypothetical protein N0F65_005013 [Lagenidium giganteum]|uniref:Polyprotein n=1 Tax=Lagenidium giganteum TaxID=4803 RepID=A0AAV2ZLJ7_9STRA|nr:TPA: hypothetical protein N0F65_005013 [Lagenidium giganteum]
MRMTLARKGLLDHIETAQGIEIEHQSKIRSTNSALQAWHTLREYYNRANIHNRVALTKKLHDFAMEDGSSMSAHLDRFDELVVATEAVGDGIDEARQLVVLLGSLPSSYDMIVSIIENAKDISLIEVKEKLLKEKRPGGHSHDMKGAATMNSKVAASIATRSDVNDINVRT